MLAFAGQLSLEKARAADRRPSVLGVIALIGAAGLAVAAFRKSDFLPGPPQPIEPPRFPPALYAACVPGALCLVLALLVHLRSAPGAATAAYLWITGVGLFLLPGFWDWIRGIRQRPTEPGRDRRRFAAAAGVLFVLAFAVRVWGGIEGIPGWLDSDEARTGIDGRGAFAEGPRALLGFWDMGNPHLTLFVSQIAAAPFGDGLRALRLGSALLGSLTVVFLFDLGRRLVGSRAAFLAALLLAVNHVFLHYSRAGQIYVDTPFFTSLVLALLLRVLTGGSFLALTAAGIAMAIGAATYVPTAILPVLTLLTLVGWAMVLRWPGRRLLPIVAFLVIVSALTVAPIVATVFRVTPEIAYQRIPAISVLRPEGLGLLTRIYDAESPREAIVQHVLRTIGVFNFGGDHFKAYGAPRGLNDAVTAALIPVAYALLLSRLASPIGWLCIVFTGAYLSGGVLFVAAQPSFHRVAVVLLFSCLAVAWTLVGLARALVAEARVVRWLPAATVFALVGASAALNLRYYFREIPHVRHVQASFGVGRLVCRYAGTHTIVDATGVPDDQYPELECPGARRVRIDQAARIWKFPERTDAARVAVIVPTTVESDNPGQPRGYRLVRRYVDRSIRNPAELSVSVLEFERSGKGKDHR